MNDKLVSWPNQIKVQVKPAYLAEQSNPDNAEFVFSYTVEISNLGDESVQLLSRHWIITDGNNQVREVQGDGVIGQQPHISPGETYRYSSGAILTTKTGIMEGSYTMQSGSGDNFQTEIPAFGLIHPDSLQ